MKRKIITVLIALLFSTLVCTTVIAKETQSLNGFYRVKGSPEGPVDGNWGDTFFDLTLYNVYTKQFGFRDVNVQGRCLNGNICRLTYGFTDIGGHFYVYGEYYIENNHIYIYIHAPYIPNYILPRGAYIEGILS